MTTCKCRNLNCGNPAHRPNVACQHGVVEIHGDASSLICSPCADATEAERKASDARIDETINFEKRLAAITQEGYRLKVRQLTLGDGSSDERAANAARILAIIGETNRIRNLSSLQECLIQHFPPSAILLPKTATSCTFSVRDKGQTRIFGISDEALGVLENTSRLLAPGDFASIMRSHGLFDRVSASPVLIMASML